jgi:hypothetical protein
LKQADEQSPTWSSNLDSKQRGIGDGMIHARSVQQAFMSFALVDALCNARDGRGCMSNTATKRHGPSLKDKARLPWS